MSSTSTHSRLEVPARGWTRTDRTRPATRTRLRHCTSPMGMVPRARDPKASRSKAALAAASLSAARAADRAARPTAAGSASGVTGRRRHSRRLENQPPVSW